jgi:hypothetical protein
MGRCCRLSVAEWLGGAGVDRRQRKLRRLKVMVPVGYLILFLLASNKIALNSPNLVVQLHLNLCGDGLARTIRHNDIYRFFKNVNVNLKLIEVSTGGVESEI